VMVSLVFVSFFYVLNAHAAPLQVEITEPGIEVSRIAYKEPGLMTERGFMYGFTMAYSLISNVQWKVEGKLSTGRVKYTGALMDGTPLSVSGITDTMLEIRGLWGLAKPHAPYFQGPFMGVGYRYLNDGADKSQYGYRREANYYYVPLGLEHKFDAESNSGWTAGFVIEYDYFWFGKQVSDLSNEQKDGYGYRASLKFRRSTDRVDMSIEPFIRYWNIAQSDTQIITYYGYPYALGYEPANNSTEIGCKFIVRF